MRFKFSQIVITALTAALACKSGDRDTVNAQGVEDTIGMARHAPVMARSAVPYRVATVADAGKLTGTVTFTGVPQGDTTIVVPADQNGCNKPLTIRRLERRNGLVSGVLVWITDVRSGRALPADRRFELDNNDCAWSPSLQAVIVGGALNVVNYDPLAERAYITNVASGDTVNVAPFTDDGQLIPYDKLLRNPGAYEFSMESRPMSRAWIAVMDQPYFAVTDASGAFSIDGVPPGTHHVRAWHPMLGTADGTVTVAPDGTATTGITFR